MKHKTFNIFSGKDLVTLAGISPQLIFGLKVKIISLFSQGDVDDGKNTVVNWCGQILCKIC